MNRNSFLYLSVALAALTLVNGVSSAPKYGMAGCGLGSIIFTTNDKSQILAATTNGTYGNQTFGITSGTSNCTADGIVKNEKAQEVFATVNFGSLEQEMAAGKGEKLNTFAHLLGCSSDSLGRFGQMTQSSYSRLMSENSTPASLIIAVKSEIKKDANLSKACSI